MLRNGSYSKAFGSWCQLTPEGLRDGVLEALRPLAHHRKVAAFRGRLLGREGPALIINKACELAHLLRNFVDVQRSVLATCPGMKPGLCSEVAKNGSLPA